MKIIHAVSIKNFRSIDKLDSPFLAENMNVILGLNDSGKSNFLKALNLFFCGKTEFNTDFRFEDDFCKYAKDVKGKASEIEIAITFQLPRQYKTKNLITWKKIWRRSGFYEEKFQDEKGKTYKTKKTKSIAWLRKLKYYYVPAIRDEKYFNYLMGLIHDVLQECNSKAFSNSSMSFLDGIKKQMANLVEEITSITDMKSEIQMPSDFKQLFATLDFSLLTNKQYISITKRGDGIKAQHIPAILHFIANVQKKRKTKQLKADIIWGFEEPENNLELSKAFSMAEHFAENSKNIQIFISTHSPAFYMLSNKPNAKLYWASRNSSGKTVYAEKSLTAQVDEDMGLMPIIAPYIQSRNEEMKKRTELEEKLKSLTKNQKKVMVYSEDEKLDLLNLLLRANGIEEQAFSTISYKGRTNIKQALLSCKTSNFDEDSVKFVVFHRDHDTYDNDEPDKDYIDNFLKELNENSKGKIEYSLFITENYDLESYLINPKHILQCCKDENLDIEEQKVESIIEKATKSVEDESISKLLANKRYGCKGGGVDYKLVKQNYFENPVRWRYGKSVLKQIKSELQGEFKKNINLEIVTDFLKIKTFQDIKDKLNFSNRL